MSKDIHPSLSEDRRIVKRLRIQKKFDVRATFFSYDNNMSDCHIFEGRIFDLSQSGIAFQITADILGDRDPESLELKFQQRIVFLLDIPEHVSWSVWQEDRFTHHYASNRIVLGGQIVRHFLGPDNILRYAAKFDGIVDGQLVRDMLERSLKGMISNEESPLEENENGTPIVHEIVFLSKMEE